MFSENNKWNPVPHIISGERAYATEDNPDKSPGKQLQALVDRTYAIAQALGLKANGDTLEKSPLINLLSFLDSNGKLPPNSLLFTDGNGNLAFKSAPKIQLQRTAFAVLMDRPQSGGGANIRPPDAEGWVCRVLPTPFASFPQNNQGISTANTWIGNSSTASFQLRNKGTFFLNAIAVAYGNTGPHQLRIRRGTTIFHGGIVNQSQATGHYAQAIATFTISESQDIFIEHKITRNDASFNPNSFGASGDFNLRTTNVFCFCSIVHTFDDSITIF